MDDCTILRDSAEGTAVPISHIRHFEPNTDGARPMTDAEKMREAMSGGSALIVEGAPEYRFSMVPNELCDSRSPYRVGAAAAGYWLAIKSKPPTWRFSFSGFVSTCAEGRTAVRSGLDELESRGWLLRLQPKSRDGRFGSGALWVLLHDPRDYGGALRRYLSAGFVKSSKVGPSTEPAARPLPENTPDAVENSVENRRDEGRNVCAKDGNDVQNPRSEPMCRIPDIGETTAILNNIKYKNINTSEAADSEAADSAQDGGTAGRSPEGSLRRGASAPLRKTQEEKTGERTEEEPERTCETPAPASFDERFSALERAYPRPSRGEARAKAAAAFSNLLDSGVSADEVMDAARRYAAAAEECKTPTRYTLSLLTFLRDSARGFQAWRRPDPRGGDEAEADKHAVLEAYRKGRALDAELVPAWARQSADPDVSAAWARLSAALEKNPRLEAHEEYDALWRMAHSRAKFGDFAKFAARKLAAR